MRGARAQVVLALLGLAALVWAVFLSGNPTIVCRDQVMAPGQVCANAEGTKTQTYAERYAAAQHARPVVGAVGAGAIVFAWFLHRGNRTTPARRRQDSSDIGP